MKRIACKRSLSLRQHFARGPKVKGGEGQLELPGIPAPTLADHARAVEVKLADSIARALNRGWKATKRTIREIVKPEPKPVQLDITLRDAAAKPLTKQEAAAAWLRDHAAELKDFDCDKLDRKPLCGRTHDGEGAHPIAAGIDVDTLGHSDDPAALIEATETVAAMAKQSRYCRDVLAEATAALDAVAAVLPGYRGKETAERTAERRRAEERDRDAAGQIAFDAWGFAV